THGQRPHRAIHAIADSRPGVVLPLRDPVDLLPRRGAGAVAAEMGEVAARVERVAADGQCEHGLVQAITDSRPGAVLPPGEVVDLLPQRGAVRIATEEGDHSTGVDGVAAHREGVY